MNPGAKVLTPAGHVGRVEGVFRSFQDGDMAQVRLAHNGYVNNWRRGDLTVLTDYVGIRVRLIRDVDRYPHFIAKSGSLGTVVWHDDFSVDVRMDDHLPGAEEWENAVVWTREYDLPNYDGYGCPDAVWAMARDCRPILEARREL